MKNILAFLIIIFLANSSFAQNSLVTASNTTSVDSKITKSSTTLIEDGIILSETEFNFGKIPQGKPVTHTFEINNKGKDSLHIVNVQASCGCTTPEWEREKVQASGEKAKITVGFNAASEGPFSKLITITYNGVQTKQITIKGEVWKTPVTSAPENIAIKNLKDL